MARSHDASFFFRVSCKGIIGFFIINSVMKLFNEYNIMIQYAISTSITCLFINPSVAKSLETYLGVLGKRRPSYTNCCVVASLIKVVYDSVFKMDDDMTFFKILPLISIGILSGISLVWDRDYTGITEGMLISSGKWFIINCMARKFDQSMFCGMALAYSIVCLVTSVGEPLRERTDAATPPRQNPYFTGVSNEGRKRSAIVLKFFWVCSLLVQYIGGIGAIWLAYKFLIGYTETYVLLSLGVLFSVAGFIVGIAAFKELLTEFIKYQQSKEERRWFVAVATMGIFEVLFDEKMLLQLFVISAMSMLAVCVISSGWDFDRSGFTDGLAITYFQWTALSLLNSKSSLQSIVCGVTLSFVVASKLTEPLE